MDPKKLQTQARDLLSRLNSLRKQAESLGAVDLRLQIQRRVQEDAENSAHFMSMPEPDLSNINKQQKYKYKLGIKKKKAKTITGSTNYKKKKIGGGEEEIGEQSSVEFDGHFPKQIENNNMDKYSSKIEPPSSTRPAWGAGPGGTSPQKRWLAKKDDPPNLPKNDSVSDVSIYYDAEVLRAKAEYKKIDPNYLPASSKTDKEAKWWLIKGTGVTEELQELLDYDKRQVAKYEALDPETNNTAIINNNNNNTTHYKDRDILNYEREQRRRQHHHNILEGERQARLRLAKELKEEEEKAKELAKQEARRGLPSSTKKKKKKKNRRRPNTSPANGGLSNSRQYEQNYKNNNAPSPSSSNYIEKKDTIVHLPSFKDYHTKSQKIFLLQESSSEWLDAGHEKLKFNIEQLQNLIKEKEAKENSWRPM